MNKGKPGSSKTAEVTSWYWWAVRGQHCSYLCLITYCLVHLLHWGYPKSC